MNILFENISVRIFPFMKLIVTILGFSLLLGCSDSRNRQNERVEKVDYDSLSQILWRVYSRDQQDRRELESTKDSFERMKMEGVITRTDATNKLVVVGMLDKYGWLPSSKIGELASQALFLVIQHSDTKTMEKYFPLLKAAAEKNEARKTDAAMMEDRLLMNEGKKQKYGTQGFSKKMENGAYEIFIWPIEQPEKVNELRKSIGFDESISDYAIKLGAEYDPHEKLIPLIIDKFPQNSVKTRALKK